MLVRLRSALAERYAIQRELGQGGSAVVFLAQDLRHSRPVAIKVLRPELAAIMGAERFLREIETVARLQHPHILPLYDSGDAAGLLYFVMPFVSGESLRDLLERERQLPVEQAVAIARDVAVALAYAHGEGVIHRDIKPENILLFGGKAVVADFGIARAIRVAGAGRITEANRVPGTPLYMSPEQSTGSEDIDGRSDIYSLAIVLYEMLGGQAPFTGISPIDVMVHQIKDAPRPLSELRKSLPSSLTLAIARALAKAPADRFPTVTEFADAIAAPTVSRDGIAPPGIGKRWLIAAGVAGLLAAGVAGRAAWARWPGLDADLHVVVPFADAGADTTRAVGGHTADFLIYESMKRMRGTRVVDPMIARDAWNRSSGKEGLAKVVSVARKTGAGLAVWGEVSKAADSVFIRAGIYSVGRSAVELRSRVVGVKASDTRAAEVGREVAALVAGLLLETVPELEPSRWLGTDTLPALNAFAAGYGAVQQGDIELARKSFREAVVADPAYAHAYLWLAQTESWVANRRADWRSNARIASSLEGRMSSWRDSAMTEALVALADSQYTRACDRYRAVLARDQSDPVAWFGLGECQRLDDVIVPAAGSPTGWLYRSSMEAALRAYQRALDLAPTLNYALGMQVYSRAASALYAESHMTRPGRIEGQGPPYRAFSGLDHDTLAFVPYPIADFIHGAGLPATHVAAVFRSRGILQGIATRWVAAYPNSAEAHASLAEALERQGMLTGDVSALRELDLALSLVREPVARLKMRVGMVRLHLKAGAWRVAAVLADSILAEARSSGADASEYLSALAALRGRADLAANYHANAGASRPVFDVTTGQRIQVGSDLALAARKFEAYAAFGAPLDSLLRFEREVRTLIVSRYPTRSQQDLMRYVLLGDGAAFAFFELGPAALPPPRATDYLAPMLLAVAAGRPLEARARLDSIERLRRPLLPSDIALLNALPESRVYLALGDSAAALAHLAAVVDGFSVSRTGVLDDPLQSAAVVRAFALRAQLALASGDSVTARRFAEAVVTLWAGADASQQTVLDGARHIAGLR